MNLLDAITEVVAGMDEVVGDPIVTGFVVLAEFSDGEDSAQIFSDTLEGQRCHQTIGLLGWGMAVESQRAANAALGDPET